MARGNAVKVRNHAAAAVALLLCALLLPACATRASSPDLTRQLALLLPADVLLLGEQHDAPDHQRLERAVVQELTNSGQLAALAIEMAEQGHSTTGMARSANEADVRFALHWAEAGWPWENYGPVVMAAVRAGVPVLGANLPRAAMRTAMADRRLDTRLAPQRLEQQREKIRDGHCAMLPEDQLTPMTRIQIARDTAMASTLVAAARPGKTVLLVAGGGHVVRDLGVPVHLPAGLRASVLLATTGAPDQAARAGSDALWETPALPPTDHCAAFKPRG